MKRLKKKNFIRSLKKGLKYQRKRWMTLLEVLVAMSILSILLVIIFGFFRELTKIDELTHFQQIQTFQRRYLEFRLNYLFSRLVNEKDSQRSFYFFLDQADSLGENSKFNSLVFTYNNGVRLNPAFSGDLIARLYVNAQGQLCLMSWPYRLDNPVDAPLDMQKEILLENVENISYDFFAASLAQDSPQQNPQQQGPRRGVWQGQEWLLSYKETPVLMKLILTVKGEINPLLKKNPDEVTKKEELNFLFCLPVSQGAKNYIHYSG